MYLYSSNPDFRSSVSITNCWFGFSRCGSSDTFTNLKFRIYDFFNEYLLWFLFSTGELRKNVCYEPMGSLFLFQFVKQIGEIIWFGFSRSKNWSQIAMCRQHIFYGKIGLFTSWKIQKLINYRTVLYLTAYLIILKKVHNYIIRFQLLNVSEIFLMGFVQNPIFSFENEKKCPQHSKEW